MRSWWLAGNGTCVPPEVTMAGSRAAGHHRRVKVIAAGSPRPSKRAAPLARGVMGGMLLVAAGIGVVGLIAATGILEASGHAGDSRFGQQIIGSAAWGLAFLIPGLFVVLGLARIVRAVENRPGSPRVRPAAAERSRISDDYLVAQGIHLPDGRSIPEVVIGPHGLTIVEELPPRRASRQGSHHWEVRDRSGRWHTVEHPVDRAARDVERLRRWLGAHLDGYTPRFTAVIVSDDDRVSRSTEVAVIRQRQLADFLDAQPAQRQMSTDRRERIAALLRPLVDA